MKKLLLVPVCFAAMILFSCSNDDNRKNTQEDVRVQPAPEPATTPPPTAPKDKDGTTIKIDDGGFDMKSNDGDNKTDVRLGDSSGVEIKRNR